MTGGMLLLVCTLIKAPDVGWGTARTIGMLAAALAILTLFLANERRQRAPLVPLAIFRVKGLAAADATQLLAMAGFFSLFFFLTLYMQQVLGFSPIQAGAAYLPVTACLALAAGASSQLFARIGTRPVIVGGALVGVTTAANARVPPETAGLAAGLLSASQQLGMALGLAIASAVATARTNDLLDAHVLRPEALTSGYRAASSSAARSWPLRHCWRRGSPSARASAQPLVVGEEPTPDPAL